MKGSNFLVIAFLAFVFSNCSGTKYNHDDYIRYSDFASYSPQKSNEIYGCYYSNHGSGGTFIELNKDSTYFLNRWASLFDESDPVEGFEGTFSIDQDSLFLNFSQFKIDYSKDSTRIATIKEKEIEYRDLKPTENWLFKRIGNNIFLVSVRMNHLFGQFSLENRGLPEVIERNDRFYGEFFPLKMSGSSCSEMVTNQ